MATNNSPMATLVSVYEKVFPAPRLYLQLANGVEEPVAGRGRRYWIVSRALCHFFKVELPADASLSRQRDALRLAITRLSPFNETGSHFDLASDFASVWLWDQQAVRSAAEAAGIDVARVRVLPETALLPRGDEGVRLVKTMEGVEGQSWAKNNLLASRWWPHPPSEYAWLMFQRGASVPADRIMRTPPVPVRDEWLNHPWTQSRGSSSFDIRTVDLRLVAAGVAAVLAICYGYVVAEWAHLARDLDRVRAEIATRTAEIAPVLDARAAALQNQNALRQLTNLDRLPSQLSLMARISEVLPHDATHFTDWAYSNGELELTVAGEHALDSVSFVGSLEHIDGVKNVSVERGGTDNSLHIRLALGAK